VENSVEMFEINNRKEEIIGENLTQLQYYKIYDGDETKCEKPYGIGITKTCYNEIERNVEKCEFNYIFKKENEADDMLKILIRNKVTPVNLREVLEDYVLV